MRQDQRLWTREELILAINLYCKLPFGRLHQSNPEIINLADLIKRTPGSVAYKLVNFASLDPSLKERGVKGAVNVSKLDKEVWNDFFGHWDILPYESEKLRAAFEHKTIEQINHIPESDLPKEGKVREQIIKARVNQSFFRSTVLASYNNMCCITGLNIPELLIAGHICPWAVDDKNRLNPRNGVLMNALHDRAFEAGYLTITPEYQIKISSFILNGKNRANDTYFAKYDGCKIIMPSRFLPDTQFLEYHNNERFKS